MSLPSTHSTALTSAHTRLPNPKKAETRLRADNELLSALLSGVLRATHLYLRGPMRAGGSGGGGGRGGGGGSDSEEEDEDDDDGFAVVAGSSGGVGDLPPATRAVVAALRHGQARLDAAVARHRAAQAEARAAAAAKVRALLARRRELLAAAGPDRAPPRFWLRVLRCVDAAALAITPRDAAVLQHLADVRLEVRPRANAAAAAAEGDEAAAAAAAAAALTPELEATLELEFSDACVRLAPGAARTLRKAYVLRPAGPAAREGAPSLRLQSARVLQAPEWAKAGGGGGEGGGAAPLDPTHRRARDGRVRPCASFFHLFRAGGGGGRLAFNLSGAAPAREVEADANALEAELLETLLAVLPRASCVYAAAPRADDVAAPGDEGGSEDDEDGSGDDEDGEGRGGGGEAAAARRAALKHRHDRQHAQQWKLPKGAVLIGLVLLVLIAQYLALFIQLTSR